MDSNDRPGLARCSICGELHPVATMVTGHRNPEDVPAGARAAFPQPSDWWLEDADARHAEHPRSYFVPPADRRRALRPGELVRLEFGYGPHADREGEGHAERMWVEVIDQRGDGHAHGRLRNNPLRLGALEIGDTVAFEAGNVIAIDYSDEELGYPQDEWAVVDEAVVRDDRAPDVVVRAASPDEPGREVWWMLVRQASASPSTETLNSLTDRFPGLVEPLRAGEGVWALEGGEQAEARWRRVAEDEIAASEGWRSLLAWLRDAAAES